MSSYSFHSPFPTVAAFDLTRRMRLRAVQYGQQLNLPKNRLPQAQIAPYANLLPGCSSDPSIVHFITIFDTLYFLGIVSLGIILLTAWRSDHIKRASTWFMFILAWLFTSVSNLIILGQQTGPCPGAGVCLVQAALIYGMPTLSSLYAVAFMLQVHLSVRNAINGHSLELTSKTMIMIHALPCGTFLAIVTEVVIIGLVSPQFVQRDPTGMYCHLSSGIPSKITAGITILAMTTFMILGFNVFLTIRRKWKVSTTTAPAQIKSQISPDVATRVLIFSFCPIIALAVSFVQYLPDNTSVATQSRLNIVLASLPLVAGVIFGSQRDIIRVWTGFKWKRVGGLRTF